MITIDSISHTNSIIDCYKSNHKSIGFVPTMGALHKGHLSLVTKSNEENDVTVVSIFVNPLQFNNKEDLKKYPRNLTEDIHLLKSIGTDIVFIPSVDEMYPEEVEKEYNFGQLEKVMEGSFRPGHFNGVGIVVSRLFNIVKPNNAYFGEKDFQQLAIIKRLVEIEKLDINISGCPIVREANGLAMSSRNERLSDIERKEASIIYSTLNQAVEMKENHSVKEVINFVKNRFSESNLELEYFNIVDSTTLSPIKNWSDSQKIRGFIAAYCGNVRLIDNIAF